MSESHADHNPGSSTDGGEYVIGYDVYQRYWCREPGCSVSIPVVVRNTDDDDDDDD